MQPYNYSIDLPQAPASTFLQNLIGIQQMKGLQQQREIQAQQAETQAQQAKFAQELQPLEKQKLEAAIAAQRAGTAQSMASRDVALENLRQSKETFAQQEEMKKEEKLLRQDIIDVVKNPTSATQEKLLDISTRTAFLLPKSHEPLQKMFEDFPRAGKALENIASDIIFAVQSGQPNVAAASVDKSLKAAQNSLEINPNDKDAQATVSLLGGVKSLMDEKKYGEAMVSASVFLKNKNQKAWNAVTGDLQELGKATKAVAEAKKEEAATEGQLLKNRIDQYEADNGISLQDIQKNKQEKFKLEAAERAHIESNPFVRKYIDSRTAFEMMKEAAPNASGDETLLTQFVKMGDPGSVVSVTEKGGVKNVTISDYIGSLQAKLASEGSLSPAKRKELKDQAFKMLQAPQKQYKEYQDNLEPVYRERGLNPKNIFVLPNSKQILEEAKQQATGPAGAPGLPISTGNIPVAPAGGTPSDVDAILKQFGVR